MPETLVLLHGFGGTQPRVGSAWSARCDPERYRPLALDLPGHGDAADAASDHVWACVARCSPRRPSASRCAATRWAGASPCTSRWPRPSGVAARARVEHRGDRGRGRARRSGAPPTGGSRTSWKAGPFEEFIERWRTQPLFAEDPPRSTRLRARTSGATVPGTRGGPARDRHGGDGAAVGAAGELRCRRRSWPGPRHEVRGAGRAAGRSAAQSRHDDGRWSPPAFGGSGRGGGRSHLKTAEDHSRSRLPALGSGISRHRAYEFQAHTRLPLDKPLELTLCSVSVHGFPVWDGEHDRSGLG